MMNLVCQPQYLQTTVLHDLCNFEPTRRIFCFAAEMSPGVEFRFFSAEIFPISGNTLKTNVFVSLVPATCLKSN